MSLKPNEPIALQNDGAVLRGAVHFPGAATDAAQSVSVANTATIAIADGQALGVATIVANNADMAVVALNGGLHTSKIVQAITGTWGVTLGAANNYNVYWDSGTSTYRIENRSGGARTFTITRQGLFSGQ